MELKTESGVSIRVKTEGSSKIILFDKPVRTIELKKHESSQIGTLLASSPKEEASLAPIKLTRTSRTSRPI